MPRGHNKLTAKGVAALAKPGRHSDGGGLYLFISPGSRRWIFRFTRQGKTREMGLGATSEVSLAEARKRATLARETLATDRDPIAARHEAKAASDARRTFGECANELIAAKSPEWRNAVHRAQWRSTLEGFAAPLWNRPVDEIDREAVLSVLQPIWQRIPETASRLRGRIEAVLDAARARGLIDDGRANPARWKGHLDKLFPKRGKLSRRHHHAAMDYRAVSQFVVRLRENESVAALALELLIFTAARSGEALGAKWNEFDLETKVWSIPADRMKAGVAHRVPLSGRALAILERMAEAKTGDFVFPGQRRGRHLSKAALSRLVRGVTIHGFRSTFRDWCGEETQFPREIAEAALAHATGSAVEAAYRRGDALEKRRGLMDAWAQYLEPGRPANVVRLAR